MSVVDWYVTSVVVERDGGNVADVVAARRVAKAVVKHLLAGAGRDAQHLLYAADYADGDGVDFENRLVLLNADSTYAPRY